MTLERPIPVLRGEERLYFDGAREGRLVYQVCGACGHRQWYPRSLCTVCSSPDVEIATASGAGTIYSFTTLYRAGHPSRAEDVPYTIVLVDLDEGVRVFSELIDAEPAAVRVGLRVAVDFQELTPELTVPVFRLDARPDVPLDTEER